MSQTWIIETANKIGSRLKKEGVCYGLSAVVSTAGVAAGKIREMDSLLNRIQSLEDKDAAYLKSAIREARCLYRHHYRQARIEAEELPGIQSDSLDKLQHKLTQEAMANYPEAVQFINIAAIFEIIGIAQNAFKKRYSGLFASTETGRGQGLPPSVLRLIASETIEKKGGIVRPLAPFRGVYPKKELVKFFSSLHSQFMQPPVLDKPVSFMLISGVHAISVGYNPRERCWSVFDAEEPPIKFVSFTGKSGEKVATEIANPVCFALTSNHCAAFTTETFCVHDYLPDVSMKLSAWKQTSSYRELHDLKKPSVKQLDSNGHGLYRLSYKL